VLDASSNSSSIDAGISLNAQLIKLPTTDSKGFQQNLKVSQACSWAGGWVSGWASDLRCRRGGWAGEAAGGWVSEPVAGRHAIKQARRQPALRVCLCARQPFLLSFGGTEPRLEAGLNPAATSTSGGNTAQRR
jgi:hypothetical protein